MLKNVLLFQEAFQYLVQLHRTEHVHISLHPLYQQIRLLDLTGTAGTAHLSTSGLALNIIIDQQLHTVPMRSLTPVIAGEHRKGPLFIPSER
jgi:hypothetical protein